MFEAFGILKESFECELWIMNFYIMLKKFLLLSTIIGGILSCEKREDKLPIPKEKLYKVLTDIHLSEAAIENETIKMKDSLSKLYYEQIFQNNGITHKDFDSSMAVLSNDPILMHRIYKQVFDEIGKHDPSKTDSSAMRAH